MLLKFMDEQKEDFLTPDERASLGPKEVDVANITKNDFSGSGVRPTTITVLCGYFFISWILSILNTVGILTLLPGNATFSFNLTGFSVQGWISMIFSLLYVVSIFGYWLMKKWSVYLYAILIVLLIIFGLFTIKTVNFFFFTSLILPAVVIWTGFKHLDIMF
jgi:hypothetical protein